MRLLGQQVDELLRLLDLLDVSRITTGKLELRKERVGLVALLGDGVEASRQQVDRGSHELIVHLPSEPVLLDAGPARFGQVFLNLLSNAAKYSDPGGRIRLSARRDGGEVVVSVRDTGVRIPAAHLLRIFDIFVQVDTAWQRAQGGLGIGLSLVKEFVALHGCRVEALSDGPGKESEFVVRLPVAVDSAATPPTPAAEQSYGP